MPKPSPFLTGQDIVKKAFDELTPEGMHDILREVGVHHEPCDTCIERSVSFTIPQLPKGKMRHQTVVTLRCSKCQRQILGQRKECPHCLNRDLHFVTSMEFTPKEQREFEKFAALCAQQGMRGRDKFTGPTRVECRFFFPIPKSREKKLKEGDWHCQRPDTDNCVKSIWDAMNKLCLTDDCIVVQMYAEKRWTFSTPRTEVVLEAL